MKYLFKKNTPPKKRDLNVKLRGLDGHAWLHFQTILISFKKRSLYDIDIFGKCQNLQLKYLHFFSLLNNTWYIYLYNEHLDILLILSCFDSLTWWSLSTA